MYTINYYTTQPNAQFVSHNCITLKHKELQTPTCFDPCRIIIKEYTHQIIMYKTL
jgi:hypothetical protein